MHESGQWIHATNRDKEEIIVSERGSRDLVLKVKIRTAIDEERDNLGMALETCVEKGCVSILPIDNNRHQRRDTGAGSH